MNLTSTHYFHIYIPFSTPLQLCGKRGCMDYRTPPGSSAHGISQARILEWVAIPFPRGCWAGPSFLSSHSAPWLMEALLLTPCTPTSSLPAHSVGLASCLRGVRSCCKRTSFHQTQGDQNPWPPFLYLPPGLQ